jgi:hypothetical protein
MPNPLSALKLPGSQENSDVAGRIFAIQKPCNNDNDNEFKWIRLAQGAPKGNAGNAGNAGNEALIQTMSA